MEQERKISDEGNKAEKLTLYLAHPLPELKWGKRFQAVAEHFGYRVLNPFEGREKELEQREGGGYGKFTRDQALQIVDSDLTKIERAHFVIAYVPYPSIGTAMEIFYASAFLNKPVYTIASDKMKHHVWLQTWSVIQTEAQMCYLLKKRKVVIGRTITRSNAKQIYTKFKDVNPKK